MSETVTIDGILEDGVLKPETPIDYTRLESLVVEDNQYIVTYKDEE